VPFMSAIRELSAVVRGGARMHVVSRANTMAITSGETSAASAPSADSRILTRSASSGVCLTEVCWPRMRDRGAPRSRCEVPMNRCLRWSANVASLFCLFAAAMSAIIWARSNHGTRERLALWPRFGPYEVSSADGRICLAALPEADRHGAEVLRNSLARRTNRSLPWTVDGPALTPCPLVCLFRPDTVSSPLEALPPDLAECLSANKGGAGLDRQLFDEHAKRDTPAYR
jgi:hypothetical protein